MPGCHDGDHGDASAFASRADSADRGGRPPHPERVGEDFATGGATLSGMGRERSRGAKRVLLVDDDPDVHALIRFHLELDGFEVVVAVDGDRALELVRLEEPDLVLLDLTLPGLGGIEVLTALKADEATERIPVFLLTARTAPEDERAAAEAGAAGYLTKPFDPRELTRRLADFLREDGELSAG